MMNDVESIKIVIMDAFYEYKSSFEYTEKDFDLIKQIDYSDSVEKLKLLINSKNFESIKKILIQDKFYLNLKNKGYLPIQLKFIETIRNSAI